MKTSKRKSTAGSVLWLKILCSAGVMVVALNGYAQVDWSNAGGGNWTNDANWSTGTAPTATDTVVHEGNGSTIEVTTGGAVADYLNVSHTDTATVHVATGGSLDVGNDALIGDSGSDGVGKLVVDGGSVSIGGDIEYGRYATRHGIGELNSGSMTVGGKTFLGGRNAGSTGTMTINGGTYTATNDIFDIAGNSGNGTLNMNGGTLQLDVGDVWNPLRVGDNNDTGNGTLNLNGGTIITRGLQMDWEDADASTATINLDGGQLQVEGGFPAAVHMDDDAQMNFDEGLFVWKSDQVGDFTALVDGGYINWDTDATAMQTESWETAWTNGTSVLYADYNDANAGYTTVWSTAIPEPGTLGLIAVLAGGMLFVRRLVMKRFS